MVRILVIDGGTGRGPEWQTRLIGLGHSVPRVSGADAPLADEVAEIGADAMVGLIPAGEDGDALLRSLRDWRRRPGSRNVPLLVVADGRDWTLQRDGAGLSPFVAAGSAGVLDGLGELVADWLPGGLAGDDAVRRQAVDALEDALMGVDLAGNVAFLNRAAERLTGWSAPDAAGEPATEVFAIIGEGADGGDRVRFRKRDGSEVAIQARTVPLEDRDGGVCGMLTHFWQARPETERRQGEQESVLKEAAGARDVLRTQRLEALEHLARGFSHSFNNLLTVILGNLSLAEVTARDEVQRGLLREATFATRKAQNLVHQIMVFARGGAPVRGLLPIAPLLRQIVQERHREHPGLEYQTAFAPRETILRADPRQLRRLIENLLENAEQATGEGGVIALRCLTDAGGPGGSGWLVIEVEDHGVGMDGTVLEQAFEPFFSTRQPLNASGLGLTVCEAIVRAHGGSVSLRSEPGAGTVVTVRLPLEAPAAGAGSDAERPRETVRTGHAPHAGGRILILEDESLIRRLILTTLTQVGHRVDEAREGQEAINAYREGLRSGDPYDLLIMDLTIENGMGGVEALRRIQEFDPGACAIVSSGYSDDPAMAEPARYGFSGVLPKPYQPVELIEAVEVMLGRLRELAGKG